MLRSHLGLIDLNDADVYAELGLEKYPQPVFLKGPLTLSYGGKHLDLDGQDEPQNIEDGTAESRSEKP